MKLVALALASLVALVDARVADACGPPAPTCGDEFCTGPIGVMEATIEGSPITENFETTILIHVTNGWGMTDGIPVGSDRTLKTTQPFSDEDLGKSYVLYLERNRDGDLSIQRRLDLTDYYATMCFGDGVTAESVATVALADDCYLTLTPTGPSSDGGCPTGIDCSTGGARSGLPIAFALAGLVVRRRRRRA
jgi:hypothetical protein